MVGQDSLINRVKKTIKKYALLKPKSRILIGVSGGPDSICLLHILNQLKDEYKLQLFAFHLNHQLRGKESDEDEKFVKQFCQKLKIPCQIKRAKVRKYAKQKKLSLEQAAREVRYQLLEQTRKRLRCDGIALGHNANDNAETVILNLVRGTGLTGLCGIPPIRDRIIRPLLEIERDEIMQYLINNKLTYRVDKTNRNPKIPRNFIRTKIIPQLKKLNPRLIETISKLSNILRQEDSYLNGLTDNVIEQIRKERSKPGITLDNKLFLSYNLALRRRVLKSLLPTLGYDKIEQILKMSEEKTVGTIQLTKDLFARQEYDRIYLGKKVPIPINQAIPIPIGKSSLIKDMGIEIEVKLKSKIDLNSVKVDKNTEVFDYSELAPPFYLRYRRPGDRFIPFGGQEKKLKEILIDDKIPRRVRLCLPLFCDAKGILWILGGRRSARAPITPKTKRFLLVRIKQWKDQTPRTV